MRRRDKKKVFSFGDIKYQKYDKELQRKRKDEEAGAPPAVRRNKKGKNPIVNLAICFLISCAVIDGSLYAYFKFYKKQTFIEGMKTWRGNVRNWVYNEPLPEQEKSYRAHDEFAYVPKLRKNTAKSKKAIKPNSLAINSYYPETESTYLPKKSYRQKNVNRGNGNVYTWRDEDGGFHASNVGLPKGQVLKDVSVVKEANVWQRETPIQIKGSMVLVPIVIGHNGSAFKSKIVLDTAASHTVLSYRQLAKVKGDFIRFVSSKMSNGGTVKGQRRKLDYIQIGPFIERNFEVNSQKRAGVENTGLLGMDFLKKHPFSINFSRKVITWL